jgi:osmotically-inducible protein OsmY
MFQRHQIIRYATLALVAGMLSTLPATARQKAPIKDGWLVTKVHSEFVDEAVLSGSNIDVDVKNGIVTLQGTVPSEAARQRAVAIAKANDGVKSVVDQLRIVAPASGDASSSSGGGTIERAGNKTGSALGKAGEKTGGALDKAGKATGKVLGKISGKAGRAVEKAGDKAGDGVNIAGEKSGEAARKSGRVVDDGWIKSKIYAKYLADWNDVLDDSDIDVAVDHGVVTLNGTVKSAAARTRAVATARNTDGVKTVNDNLRVSATK